MNAKKTKAGKEKTKSGAFGFGQMGHGMSEMMTKCCGGVGSFPDCLTMMEEMKKQCCTPNKDVAEPERNKK